MIKLQTIVLLLATNCFAYQNGLGGGTISPNGGGGGGGGGNTNNAYSAQFANYATNSGYAALAATAYSASYTIQAGMAYTATVAGTATNVLTLENLLTNSDIVTLQTPTQCWSAGVTYTFTNSLDWCINEMGNLRPWSWTNNLGTTWIVQGNCYVYTNGIAFHGNTTIRGSGIGAANFIYAGNSFCTSNQVMQDFDVATSGHSGFENESVFYMATNSLYGQENDYFLNIDGVGFGTLTNVFGVLFGGQVIDYIVNNTTFFGLPLNSSHSTVLTRGDVAPPPPNIPPATIGFAVCAASQATAKDDYICNLAIGYMAWGNYTADIENVLTYNCGQSLNAIGTAYPNTNVLYFGGGIMIAGSPMGVYIAHCSPYANSADIVLDSGASETPIEINNIQNELGPVILDINGSFDLKDDISGPVTIGSVSNNAIVIDNGYNYILGSTSHGFTETWSKHKNSVSGVYTEFASSVAGVPTYVTNIQNAAGITTSGIFSGNGSGLTNVTAQTLISGATTTNETIYGDANNTNWIVISPNGELLTNTDGGSVLVQNGSIMASGSISGSIAATNLTGTVAQANLPLTVVTNNGSLIITGATASTINGFAIVTNGNMAFSAARISSVADAGDLIINGGSHGGFIGGQIIMYGGSYTIGKKGTIDFLTGVGSGSGGVNVLAGSFDTNGNLTVVGSITATNGFASYAPHTPAAVTVGASPFSYTNTTPIAQECYFSGATAYAVTKMGASVYASMTGNSYFILQPSNYCSLTYTSAPTMFTNSW